jgi:hypothetical protein
MGYYYRSCLVYFPVLPRSQAAHLAGSSIFLYAIFSVQFPLDLFIYSKRLAHTLHPIIIATFLDCAPAAFGLDSTNSTELELIASITDISRSLYGALLQGDSFVRLPHLRGI